jgi:hypothetical protein
MSVALKGLGAYSANTGPTPSATGGGPAAGDRSVMFVSAKYAGTAVIGAVTNWTEIARASGGIPGTGNDAGATEIVAYVRDGAFSGAQAVDVTGQQNYMAVIATFTRTLGAWAALASAAGDDATGASAVFSAVCTTNPGATAGDALVAGTAIPTDLGSALASGSINGTGISAGTAVWSTYAETATGTDAAAAAIVRTGFTGTLTAAPTVAITYTGAANTYGPALLVRLRDEAASVSGTVDVTLPALDATFAGEAVDQGAVDVTLPALAATFAGEVLSPVEGAVDIALPALGATFAGEAVDQGAVDIALPALDATFAGEAVDQGAVDVTLPALDATFAGDVEVEGLSGVLDVTLPALAVALVGHVEEVDLMMLLGEAAESMRAELAAAGIRAVLDVEDVNPPCVLILLDTIEHRILAGDPYFAQWHFFLIAQKNKMVTTYNELDGLHAAVRPIFQSSTPVEAQPLQTNPGANPVPALHMSVRVRIS